MCPHLKSTGEEGQNGRTPERGWQLSFKKSLQQNTRSLFWLKLVPYLTGAYISVDMYLDLSSKGSSKNLLLPSTMLRITSFGIPWFVNCIHTNKNLPSGFTGFTSSFCRNTYISKCSVYMVYLELTLKPHN